MKNEANIALVTRREVLIAQIANERADLAQKGASLRFAAQVVDRIREGLQHLKKHPESFLLPLALTVVSRPRRLLGLGISGLGLWRLLLSWRRRLLS